MLGEPTAYGGAQLPLDSMTDVYKSMIDRIGVLSEAQVRAVLRAYLLDQQLPDRLKFLGKPGEPGYVWVPIEKWDALAQLHRNYVDDVERAIGALSG